MIHMCPHCNKLIEDDDLIEIVIEGKYKRAAAPNQFQLHKEVAFRTGTMGHVDCDYPKEGK